LSGPLCKLSYSSLYWHLTPPSTDSEFRVSG